MDRTRRTRRRLTPVSLESLNPSSTRADEHAVSTLDPGTILIDPQGRSRIVRSRTASDDGWNCTDGAPRGACENTPPELNVHSLPCTSRPEWCSPSPSDSSHSAPGFIVYTFSTTCSAARGRLPTRLYIY